MSEQVHPPLAYDQSCTGNGDGGRLTEDQLATFTTEYQAIMHEGLEQDPRRTASKGTKPRGRIKQTKIRNLLDRLDQHQVAVLRFMRDFRVPYTDNQVEQDIRMIKKIPQ